MRLYDEIIHDILTSLEKQDKHILPVGAAAYKGNTAADAGAQTSQQGENKRK